MSTSLSSSGRSLRKEAPASRAKARSAANGPELAAEDDRPHSEPVGVAKVEARRRRARARR